MRGPFWNSNHIMPLATHTRRNMLYIEPTSSEEIRDGDYIKTSIGSGIVYVWEDLFRKMESSSRRTRASQRAICTRSGRISCCVSPWPTPP